MTHDLRTLGRIEPIREASLAGDAPEVAPALLGALLVRDEPTGDPTVVRIVETEAYRQDDPASHTYRGRTGRNEVMFGRAGRGYVYFTYGMHFCVNVVCGVVDEGAAVLLRAAVPLTNLDLIRSRRPAAKRDRDLLDGPAKLTQALEVARELDGVDLVSPDSPLRLATDGFRPDPADIAVGPRVGVREAADVPWRFWLPGTPEVSRYNRHPRARTGRPGR